MAAIARVFTIRRAAQILGRDEDLLWALLDNLQPEDGLLWVYDIEGESPAFTDLASLRCMIALRTELCCSRATEFREATAVHAPLPTST